MDYDIAFRLLFIQTKFLPGLTFPFVMMAGVPGVGNLWITTAEALNMRVSIIRQLEAN